MNHPEVIVKRDGKRPYQAPAIVFESPLEAQAGSPVGTDPLQDLLDDVTSPRE